VVRNRVFARRCVTARRFAKKPGFSASKCARVVRNRVFARRRVTLRRFAKNPVSLVEVRKSCVIQLI